VTAAEAGGLVGLALLALALGAGLWFAWPRLPAKWRLGLAGAAALILAGAISLISSRSKRRNGAPPERDMATALEAEREVARAAVQDEAEAGRDRARAQSETAREGVERAAADNEDTDESLAGRMGRLRPRGEKDGD
jgi:apolipoprotein N-acyltransferase